MLRETIESRVKQEVDKILVGELKQLLARASQVVLSKAIKIIEATAATAAPASLNLTLGPFQITVDDPCSKLETLSEISRSVGPFSSEDISRYVRELSPSDLALVLEDIRSLDVGCTLHWSPQDIADNLPAILSGDSVGG